ncbi:MAG: exo-alpha-sialidase [Fimbriimonadaceae bacterium]|nr:exo-alpha-sialidase [Fimbriimonadaceae bacterium]
MEGPAVVATAAQIGQRWAGIPGVERTAAGRLFVSFFSGGDREPDVANTVYLCHRDEAAAAWTTPEVLAAPWSDGTRAFDPTLWLDPTGTLWLIYNRGNQATARHDVWARRCVDPDAAELAWSAEHRLGFEAPYALRMNKPTVLRGGVWALPVTLALEPVPRWFAGDTQLQGAALSPDQGQTWQLHGAVQAPPWALENMLLEISDGGLRMFIRTGAGVIWQATSPDGGFTWSPASPTRIANPGSRFFIRRLADGSWLLLNSPDSQRRTAIVACRSQDEGASWSPPLVLDPRDAVSYPDACVAAGTVWAVHDRDRGGAAEILLTSFTLAELPARGGQSVVSSRADENRA